MSINRNLHRTLFGIWLLFVLFGLLAAGWAYLMHPTHGGNSELDILVFLAGLAFAVFSLFPLVGHILILRGVRAGGVLVVVGCALPLFRFIESCLGQLADARLPIYVVLPIAFLGLNVWAGIRAAMPPSSGPSS